MTSQIECNSMESLKQGWATQDFEIYFPAELSFNPNQTPEQAKQGLQNN